MLFSFFPKNIKSLLKDWIPDIYYVSSSQSPIEEDLHTNWMWLKSNCELLLSLSPTDGTERHLFSFIKYIGLSAFKFSAKQVMPFSGRQHWCWGHCALPSHWQSLHSMQNLSTIFNFSLLNFQIKRQNWLHWTPTSSQLDEINSINTLLKHFNTLFKHFNTLLRSL